MGGANGRQCTNAYFWMDLLEADRKVFLVVNRVKSIWLSKIDASQSTSLKEEQQKYPELGIECVETCWIFQCLHGLLVRFISVRFDRRDHLLPSVRNSVLFELILP